MVRANARRIVAVVTDQEPAWVFPIEFLERATVSSFVPVLAVPGVISDAHPFPATIFGSVNQIPKRVFIVYAIGI